MTALTEPKGNLAMPCGVNPDGNLRPLLVDADGKLITAGGGAGDVSLYRARAFPNSNDSIGDSAFETLKLDAESFDPNANFNTATYTYTVPVAGTYLLMAQVSFLSAVVVANKSVGIRILKGGAQMCITLIHAAYIADIYALTNNIAALAANDEITVEVYQSFGAAKALSGNTARTFFAVHCLSLA